MREPTDAKDHRTGGARRLNLVGAAGADIIDTEAMAWSYLPLGAHRRAVLDTLLAHLADLDAYRAEVASLVAELQDGLERRP